MSARFYSPGLGAFTQLDTVMGSAQNPLSMNRYLYAHANPWTYVDPTGHMILCEGEMVNCGAHQAAVKKQDQKRRAVVRDRDRHQGGGGAVYRRLRDQRAADERDARRTRSVTTVAKAPSAGSTSSGMQAIQPGMLGSETGCGATGLAAMCIHREPTKVGCQDLCWEPSEGMSTGTGCPTLVGASFSCVGPLEVGTKCCITPVPKPEQPTILCSCWRPEDHGPTILKAEGANNPSTPPAGEGELTQVPTSTAHAPVQGIPFGLYYRYYPDGTIKQVTTYNEFGQRIRQYEFGPGYRQGDHYHTFETDAQRPDGVRDPTHRPL
jgi:hypothetical protein